MTRPVVLLLSTYPIRRSRHGGQIRLQNVKRCYEQHGFDTIECAVCAPGSYKKGDLGKNDILIERNSPHYTYNGAAVPFIDDLLTSVHVSNVPAVSEKLLKTLPSKVHAIHLEQPWLWPLVEQLIGRSGFEDTFTVFGSQNIESELKSEILAGKVNGSTAASVLADIDQLERHAATRADLCLAVTQSDVNTLIEWGAKEVILAANGVEPRSPGQKELDLWTSRLPEVPFAAYIASAHPPNFEDFLEVCGGSLGCFPPNSRLVTVGSVSDPLEQVLAASRYAWLNMSRYIGLGELPDAHLDAIKSLASLFVIPILQGGGSNLKTAEAIYSGKHVVTTPVGIRGFEDFVGLPGISVAKNPREFQDAVRSVLSDGTGVAIDERRSRLAEKLTWSECLREAAARIAGRITENA